MVKDIYMTEKELRNQLEIMLSLKWHKKDIAILAEVLFSEYQNNINLEKIMNNRESLTKMLIKGKLARGIAPDQ